jgi:hypothetical protein
MRWWLVVLPAAGALAARLLTGPRPIDDAYITFRYARNLAEGLGLVYNPGEWVLGTTAPLWALLLAGGYRLGFHDLPWLATIVSAVCDAGTAVLLAWLAVRLGLSMVGSILVGLVWPINPMSVAFATSGMETSVFVFLALAALTLAVAGRVRAAVALAGASVFVRPEGMLLGIVILGWTWFARRRELLVVGPGFLAPLLVGGLALSAMYGSPLPHSIAAKQIAYRPVWPGENVLAVVLQAGLPGWSPFLLSVAPAAAGVVLAAIGLATLAVLVRRGLVSRPLGWQPFAAFGALYVAFYVVAGLRGVRLFPWYLVPLIPLYVLGAAAGLQRLRWRGSHELAAVLLLAWQLPAVDWRQPLLPVGYTLERERALLIVGAELNQTLPSDAVIAAPEIGALGYASQLRILDTVGLVSPVAVGYYPLPPEQLVVDNAVPARLIDDQQPDVVVSLDAFVQRSLLTDAAFQRDYRLERSYPANVWRSSEVLVFHRVSEAAQTR